MLGPSLSATPHGSPDLERAGLKFTKSDLFSLSHEHQNLLLVFCFEYLLASGGRGAVIDAPLSEGRDASINASDGDECDFDEGRNAASCRRAAVLITAGIGGERGILNASEICNFSPEETGYRAFIRDFEGKKRSASASFNARLSEIKRMAGRFNVKRNHIDKNCISSLSQQRHLLEFFEVSKRGEKTEFCATNKEYLLIFSTSRWNMR
ncbi:hypothetical protein AVEN_35037-1 [Araneus ventricosus]|uniref:Uncharacterized protein n=1 Tax=Araneus ventricosus TaxID=182803 RepID=A0A4Y2RWM9_ARAVE|nr:hypothetical protein AVEN_211016-1 [Araneus ventricosus]GBN79420.1 hypothetical protein AVEN_226117-1 [Araneus ventricosus]GBN80628.1 hypothetical protein AVEN_183450-1 [Araneus ventricosus]GBN80697.1 hypothetical protein AVEN_35037-1 [Araneus ventricosus]